MNLKANYNKLVFLAILMLFAIAALMVWTNTQSFYKLEMQLENQWLAHQQLEAGYSASQITDYIHQTKMGITALGISGQTNLLQNGSSCSGNLDDIQSMLGITSIFRTDSLGNVVECAPQRYQSYLGLNIQNKDYFKGPVQTRSVFVSQPAGTGEETQIVISAPILEAQGPGPYQNPDRKFLGVYFTIIQAKELYSMFAYKETLGNTAYYVLADKITGQVIEQNGNFTYQGVKKALNGKVYAIKPFAHLGQSIITSTDVSFDNAQWELDVLTPLSSLTKQTKAIHNQHYIEMGIILATLMIFVSYLMLIYRKKQRVESRLEEANITLQKLGIKIDTEKEVYAKAEYTVDSKGVYLATDDEDNQIYEIFASTLNKGYSGLGIIRQNPEEFKKKYNLQKTSFIWLSKSRISGIYSETNAQKMSEVAKKFIEESPKSVILIDRLDYLFAENPAQSVLQAVHLLNELSSLHDTIILIGMQKSLVQEQYVRAVEIEAVDLFGRHFAKNIALSEQESAILSFINKNNSYNKLVSYKDITREFNITKPTTRIRLERLKQLGLISVDSRGRYKAIRITSAGRKFVT